MNQRQDTEINTTKDVHYFLQNLIDKFYYFVIHLTYPSKTSFDRKNVILSENPLIVAMQFRCDIKTPCDDITLLLLPMRITSLNGNIRALSLKPSVFASYNSASNNSNKFRQQIMTGDNNSGFGLTDSFVEIEK